MSELMVIRGPELFAIIGVGWLLAMYWAVSISVAAAKPVPGPDDDEEKGIGR